MFHRLFLVTLLLSHAGQLSVCSPPQSIRAFPGQDVTLPCSFKTTAGDDIPTVEWSKEDLKPDVVFLYRDGCETYEMKHQDFQYRTSLFLKEISNGNLSLRIANVRPSDAGRYRCKWKLESARWESTAVELVVVAASEPQLVLADGGMWVQCEVGCWLRDPHISFLDEQGEDIPAGNQTSQPDGGGCFITRQRVALQTPTRRVTCRVHQPEFNHTKEAVIFIPDDCTRPCSVLVNVGIAIAIIGTALLCSVVFGLILWRCRKHAAGQQQVFRQTFDEIGLLQEVTCRAENEENASIENLERKVANLESALRMKDLTIQHLQDFIYSQHRSSTDGPRPPIAPSNQPSNQLSYRPSHRRGIQRQYSLPPLSCQPPTKYRNKSCPSVLSWPSSPSSSSATAAVKNNVSGVQRSLSLSSPQPDHAVPRPQRRHSSGLPASPHKAYDRLANLPE